MQFMAFLRPRILPGGTAARPCVRLEVFAAVWQDFEVDGFVRPHEILSIYLVCNDPRMPKHISAL